jgi:hypothetical protein
MKKKTFWIILAALAIFILFIFLHYSTIPTMSSIFVCIQDTDCISVCGSCENLTYFHSNPPPPCATHINETGARTCYCENSQCSSIINATTQPSYIQPQESRSSNNSYILIGIVVVIVFVLLGAFVNYLMKSPTETWLFSMF